MSYEDQKKALLKVIIAKELFDFKNRTLEIVQTVKGELFILNDKTKTIKPINDIFKDYVKLSFFDGFLIDSKFNIYLFNECSEHLLEFKNKCLNELDPYSQSFFIN